MASSAVVVAQTAFIVSDDGVVHALDLASGVERWSVDLGAEVESTTPLYVDGHLVIGDREGRIHALDPGGTAVWTHDAGGPVTGSAAASGDLIVAATTAGKAVALAASTGDLVWETSLSDGVSRSIAASADLAYFGSGGDLVALRVENGTIAWRTKLAEEGEGGTPTVAEGLVFAATGITADDLGSKGVAALDALTGAIVWRYASPSQDQVFTPAVVDGLAYVVGQDARVVALDAATGTQAWAATTRGPIDALPAVANGTVYVAGNSGEVAALDGRTGQMVWSAQLIAGQAYAPVVIDGYVLVGTSRGILYALADAPPAK